MTDGKSPQELLEETADKVNRIYTAFFGEPGTEDKGMMGEFQSVRDSHYKLKRQFWILIGILVGSGILGGSLVAAASGH